MANATFGVNIIPKNNTVTIGNSDSPWTVVSPNMTGTPTAPTAELGTNTTQVATTAFVNSTVSGKADKTDTVLDTTLSRGRKANTTVGTASIAFGNDVEAVADYSIAIGDRCKIGTYGSKSISIGSRCEVLRPYSVAIGSFAKADGSESSSIGLYTKSIGQQHVFGIGNVVDNYARVTEEWQPNTLYTYHKSYCVYNNKKYFCGDTHTSGNTFDSTKWWDCDTYYYLYGYFSEIVGNGADGTDSGRSNARALDRNGNEYLNGTLYVNCNPDSTGGTQVLPKGATWGALAGASGY